MSVSIYMYEREGEKDAWTFNGYRNNGVFTCAETILPEIVMQQLIGKGFNDIVEGCPKLRILLASAIITEVAMTADEIKISVEF